MLLLYEGAYFIAYRFGNSFGQSTASPFWFPDSVLLCALLATPPRRWWIFVLATLPVRLFSEVGPSIPLWFLIATFAIDSAKGVVTAGALRRLLRNPVRIETVRELAIYTAFAVVLVPALGALAGASARQALGFDYWAAWVQWYLGDALAQLVITPAALCWLFGGPGAEQVSVEERRTEVAVLATGLLLTSWYAFRTGREDFDLSSPAHYLPIPFLFWSAVRFGMPGATSGVVAYSCFAVGAALAGVGPFSGHPPGETALLLQEYLAPRAFTLYLVAILVHEMRSAQARLREAEIEKLKYFEELARVSRVVTLGAFAASVTHELRQPMTAVLTNAKVAEMLLARVPPPVGELREVVADILADEQRAGEILAQMRELLEKHEIVRRPIAANELVSDIFRLMSIEAAERGVAMHLDLAAHLPPVSGDRVHLHQVLMNLILNAFEAMAASPQSRRRLVVRTARGDDGNVELAVIDSGPGIPAERIGLLFEPLWSTKEGGLGMGLAITHSIIEAHRGKVWAENGTDGGAIFRVRLPAAGPAPSVEPRTRAARH